MGFAFGIKGEKLAQGLAKFIEKVEIAFGSESRVRKYGLILRKNSTAPKNKQGHQCKHAEYKCFFHRLRWLIIMLMIAEARPCFYSQTYFTKSSIGTPNALAIFATVCTLGLTTTLLSIFVSVVCFTPDFLTKSSWVKPSLFRAFFMFSPIVAIVSIL